MNTNPTATQSCPHDVIIIGAGASGLFCALTAAQRGVRILLLESAAEAGKKLCIAGGGKANFSNRQISPQCFLSRCANACDLALRAFGTNDALRLMEAWQLPSEERGHGQLFLQTSAKDLRDRLTTECLAHGVDLRYRTTISKVWHENGLFFVHDGQKAWSAPGLALATGSPACPQCGSSGIGLELAKSLGHAVIPFRPALAPMHMPPDWPSPMLSCSQLAGISLPVGICPASSPSHCWTDDLLFTHAGISGPATLKASLFWEGNQAVIIDFSAKKNLEDCIAQYGRQMVRTVVRGLMPQRLADALVPPSLAGRKCAELSRQQRQTLIAAVHRNIVVPQGLAGLRQAEACSGGVDMGEINHRTLESTIIPRLWFVGELLDVTGLLGGYNLHWAWASAWSAGVGMAKRFSAKKAGTA